MLSGIQQVYREFELMPHDLFCLLDNSYGLARVAGDKKVRSSSGEYGRRVELVATPGPKKKITRRIPHRPVALGALLRVNDSIHTDYKPSVYTSPLRTMLAPIRKKCLAPLPPFHPLRTHFFILSRTRRAQLNTVVQILRPSFSVPLIIV